MGALGHNGSIVKKKKKVGAYLETINNYTIYCIKECKLYCVHFIFLFKVSVWGWAKLLNPQKI